MTSPARDVAVTLGQLVRDRRGARTFDELAVLARRAGHSYTAQAWSELERDAGKQLPRRETLRMLSAVLEVSGSRLMLALGETIGIHSDVRFAH